MASVSELGNQCVGVSPVDGGLRATSEEVGGVSGERQGCARAGDLLLALNLHHLGGNLELGDGAITRSDDHVTVSQKLHAVDTHREEAVAWADALKEAAIKVDLNDVASEGTHEGARIIGRNGDALIDALDLTHLHVVVEDFLLAIVDVPDTDAVVVDSDELFASVVEEGDLVGDVHANSVADNGLSADGLN